MAQHTRPFSTGKKAQFCKESTAIRTPLRKKTKVLESSAITKLLTDHLLSCMHIKLFFQPDLFTYIAQMNVSLKIKK